MTEQEWWDCSDFQLVRVWLLHVGTGRKHNRKLRLFACACARQAWHLLDDAWGRRAVLAAEQLADRELRRDEVPEDLMEREVAGRLHPQKFIGAGAGPGAWADSAAFDTLHREPRSAAGYASEAAARALSGVDSSPTTLAAKRAAEGGQRLLLHDIFGPLLFCSVTIERRWLAWNNGAVVALARAIYGERRFEDVAVLADALEEAGCADAGILGHLRGPGPHLRGCWPIDLVLRKQ